MFERFLSARCPVDDPLHDWVVWRLEWLVEQFGEGIWRLPVVCPTTDDFPEQFDGTPSSLSAVVDRIALRIGVDPKRVDLQVYERDRRQQDLMREASLDGSWSSTGAAGYYVEEGSPLDARFTVALEASVARNPTSGGNEKVLVFSGQIFTGNLVASLGNRLASIYTYESQPQPHLPPSWLSKSLLMK